MKNYKGNQVVGVALIVFGGLFLIYNWMNALAAEFVTHQQYFAIKSIANWLMIIAGIMLLEKK